MKRFILELNNCVGYGYMSYVSQEVSQKLLTFLNDFSQWHGCTKTFKDYFMYELPEDIVNFMQGDSFKGFLIKNGIEFITSKDSNYLEIMQNEVWKE